MQNIAQTHVAVFGIGGVGGYVVEALVRSGIGEISLIDHDCVTLSNLNRQLHATHSTIGQYKIDVAKQRILDINPLLQVNTHRLFYTSETSNQLDLSSYDYIVDAIDTVSGKIELVVNAHRHHVPIMSSMGAGNKLDPSSFQVADLYQTSICPLARVMRHELRKRGITQLKVVYSTEPALKPVVIKNDIAEYPLGLNKNTSQRKQIPGSISFVPSVAGLMIAGEIINEIISCHPIKQET